MKQLLFSICIPVRDDLTNLKQCLSALKGQDLSDCEIIVCDDGSRRPLLASDLRDSGVPFTLIRQAGQGPAAARNHIAELAGGTYLFFIDADTVPRFDMLDCARGLIAGNPQLEVFYGSYDDAPAHRSMISSYKNLLHHYTHHQSARAGERVTTFWCGCGVIRRELYLEVGGLSEFYSRPSIEDIELGSRLTRRGLRIEVFPQLQVKHLKHWTLRSWLYTDLFQRGIPWIRLMRATNDWSSQLNFSWYQRLASIAAAAFVLLIPLTAIRAEFGLAALLALALFLAPNLGFIALVRRKRGLLPALGAVPLHLIYAIVCVASVAAGFLYPTLKFPPPAKLEPQTRR